MTTLVKWFNSRKNERIALLLISLMMILLFWKLFSVLKRDFAEVSIRMENGTMIDLNKNNDSTAISRLLKNGMYFEDPKDIQFIAAKINSANTGSLDNTGELNKKNYFVHADDAFQYAGKSFKNRVELSRNLLGFSQLDSISFEKERTRPLKAPVDNNLNIGQRTISGIIKNGQGQPVENVLLRLRLLPSADSSDLTEVEDQIIEYKDAVRKILVKDSAKKLKLLYFIAYARTDQSGKFSLSGLTANSAYELIPLQPGFEFGRSQGIDNLQHDVSFNFTQSPHVLKLFSANDFSTLKKEHAFIVRSPEEVSSWYWIIVSSFLFAFLLLHIIFTIRSPGTDQLILPVIMILTGLSFISLFSLQDPLRDRFLAKSTFIYFCIGIAGIIVLQFINLRRLTPDAAFFRLFAFRNNKHASNGWPWALAAISLLLLTIFFGTGPQGSGVKVNLFGFQPSEIVKYMVIVFLAGFFAKNENFISQYPSWNKRLYFFIFALAAIIATILLFLVLGDLGPAIVCCFTFIILFSFSRGDFMQVVAALVLYALCIWTFKNIWIATAVTCGAAYIIYALLRKEG